MYQQQLLVIYRAYEDSCSRSGLVDFAELLLKAHETLRDNAELLAFYRARFKYVHVDEFQDTNTVQYAWLRLLTEGQDNLLSSGMMISRFTAGAGRKLKICIIFKSITLIIN